MAQHRYQYDANSMISHEITPNRSDNQENNILFLGLNQIRVPTNGKRTQNQNNVIRIADTIKKYGVIEPLEVRIVCENGNSFYELLSNDAVWYAAQLAGVGVVPCRILEIASVKGAECVFAQLQQKKLHMFDQAHAFRVLLEEYGLTQSEIARRLGVSQSAIANKLRLLQYTPREIQQILQSGLSERHARTILRLKTANERLYAIQTASEQQLTVVETEELVEKILQTSSPLYAETVWHGIQETLASSASSPQEPKNASGERSYIRFEEDFDQPEAVLPRKFALQSLQPLYNSVDRALTIFRKTGYRATMQCEESAQEVRITIRIPTKID